MTCLCTYLLDPSRLPTQVFFCSIYLFTGLFKIANFYILQLFRFGGNIWCLIWLFGPLELAHAALHSHSNLNKGAFMSCSLCEGMNWSALIQMNYYLSSDKHHQVSGPASNVDWWSGFYFLAEGLSSSNLNWNVLKYVPWRQHLMEKGCATCLPCQEMRKYISRAIFHISGATIWDAGIRQKVWKSIENLNLPGSTNGIKSIGIPSWLLLCTFSSQNLHHACF